MYNYLHVYLCFLSVVLLLCQQCHGSGSDIKWSHSFLSDHPEEPTAILEAVFCDRGKEWLHPLQCQVLDNTLCEIDKRLYCMFENFVRFDKELYLNTYTCISLQEEGSAVTGQLLKPHPTSPPPDMSPFFLRQYVKGHANDVFEDYPQMLTEMVLRLPYQVHMLGRLGLCC